MISFLFSFLSSRPCLFFMPQKFNQCCFFWHPRGWFQPGSECGEPYKGPVCCPVGTGCHRWIGGSVAYYGSFNAQKGGWNATFSRLEQCSGLLSFNSYKLIIYSEFPMNMVIFHSYTSLPEGSHQWECCPMLSPRDFPRLCFSPGERSYLTAAWRNLFGSQHRGHKCQQFKGGRDLERHQPLIAMCTIIDT